MMKKVLFLIPLLFITTSCKKTKISKALDFELKLDGTYGVSLNASSIEKNITIPKKYNDKDVTEISGFRNNDYIETVKFYGNITNIEEGTFTYCQNLRTITVEKSNIYSTINGSLYKNGELIVYASGNTDSSITIDKNIKSKAFTLAPNLKKINVKSNKVENNAFVYLENIEEITISESVTIVSNDFYSGKELDKLIIKSDRIANTLEVKNVKNLYVTENTELSSKTKELYKKVNVEKIDEVVYDVYNLK